MTTSEKEDRELAALHTVFEALRDLSPDSQGRIIDYVCRRLNLPRPAGQMGTRELSDVDRSTEIPGDASTKFGREDIESDIAAENDLQTGVHSTAQPGTNDEGVETLKGISPVAKKWMARNSFSATELGRLFSLGVDDIDLVVKSLPGTSIRARFREGILLQGIAAYLSGGVARFTHKKLKETLKAYKADPETNITTYMKDVASDVSGSVAGGYTLTTRGFHAATDLVKEMLSPKQSHKGSR